MPVVVDLDRLDANIRRFHRGAAARGVRVRAHIKAHRTIDLAVRQVGAGAAGVAVQTAHAARRVAAAGVLDVVLAWPWPDPWRFPLFAGAAAQVSRFAVHVDRAESLTGIGAAAVDRGTEVGVRVDLRHTPERLAVALAEQAARTPGVRFDGVTGYHAPATTPEIRDLDSAARRHAEQVVAVAEAVRGRGIECPVVCVGGTPGAAAALAVPGVTEICAGAYATLDGGLAAAGVCAPEQVAISVAADATDLLEGCTQPWAPEVTALPATPPYQDRLLAAHVCPLAVTLVKRGIGIAVVRDDGGHVATWQPFAAPDRL